MAGYLAMRIEKRKLDYKKVVAKFPQYKEEIDEILILDGFTISEDGELTFPEGGTRWDRLG